MAHRFNNASTCLSPDIDINIVDNIINIHQPLILPLGFLGALIGFYHFEKFSKLKNTRGSWIYSATMFAFGCMNTAGILLNCFFPPNSDMSPSSTASYISSLIDGTFTSCVTFSFILCALVDIRILDDTKCYFRPMVYLIYGALGFGWIQIEQGWAMGFLILYILLTIIGFTAYSLLSFVWFIINRTVQGLGTLLLAIISGILGIQIFLHPGWVCTNFGPLFNSLALWYLASDTSLLLLALFFFSTRNHRKYDRSLPQTEDDEDELDEENDYTGNEKLNTELLDVTSLSTPPPYYEVGTPDHFVGAEFQQDQQQQPPAPPPLGQLYYYYDLNTQQWVPQQDCSVVWEGDQR